MTMPECHCPGDRRAGAGLLAVALVACVAVVAGGASAVAAEKKTRVARKAPPPKLERIDCMVGTEDQQARIAIEAVGGRIQNFAYYGKTKPRTCSMDVKRDDAFSKWEDNGSVTVVTLVDDTGAFLIDNEKGGYRFIFRDIDRMRYCGMDGKINGSLTVVRRQNRYTCTVDRVIIEGPD
ncbi:MAG: hypothetical protein IT529_12105 [Burkholderiales bacterium]|nr:hypothetical protein [Burkholderiales bacterium]